MNLPPDQLRVRLDAGIATIKRLIDPPCLGLDAHTALSAALWHLTATRTMLDEQHPPQPPRA